MIAAIDHHLHLLKRHLPYFESDHVLNIAFNLLAGGRRLEHIERLRNDEVYLDALGAVRIPDPTTEGDFCRRFREADVLDLMEAINAARLHVYAQQPADFFAEATVDVDGTLVATDAECKEGVDIAYDGTWGYHPLVVTLANTGEPLSWPIAAATARRTRGRIPTSIGRSRCAGGPASGGSRSAATPTSARPPTSTAGMPSRASGSSSGWTPMRPWWRGPRACRPTPTASWSGRRSTQIKTAPRQRPERVKAEVVRRRGFETIHTLEEMVAEFDYRPTACRGTYRVVVLRKRLGIDKGSVRLREEYRYFFFITNDREAAADALVLEANGRCDQENVIAQLKGGVPALKAPVDDLVSNWAYMVMASLAWTLKAWAALLLPEEPGHVEEHRAERRSWLRMEFATFRAAVIELPCQVVRGGGRLIFRLLSWNPWQGALLRLVERLRVCWLC